MFELRPVASEDHNREFLLRIGVAHIQKRGLTATLFEEPQSDMTVISELADGAVSKAAAV